MSNRYLQTLLKEMNETHIRLRNTMMRIKKLKKRIFKGANYLNDDKIVLKNRLTSLIKIAKRDIAIAEERKLELLHKRNNIDKNIESIDLITKALQEVLEEVLK